MLGGGIIGGGAKLGGSGAITATGSGASSGFSLVRFLRPMVCCIVDESSFIQTIQGRR